VSASASLDDRVRLEIYERFVETGSPPTVAETAAALHEGEHEVVAAFRRLEQARVIVLAPGTTNVWMANPLSAAPTPFRVETKRGSYWGNCAWDGLGVIAMLGGDGRLETPCPDCGKPISLRVRDGELEPADGIAHFAVPAARWWDNIAFT
jgi:Alkylmercury lyase